MSDARARASLAAARSALLWELAGLDRLTLQGVPAFAAQTCREILAAIARDERQTASALETLLAGRQVATGRPVEGTASFDETLDALLANRAALLSALARIEPDDLERELMPGETIAARTTACQVRDALWAERLRRWRRDKEMPIGVGPKSVLIAVMRAARKELLLASALLPAGERETRQIVGESTLKDVLGHVADRERLTLEGLRRMVHGREPVETPDGNREGRDREHIAARQMGPWEVVWADLNRTHQDVLRLIGSMDEASLSRSVQIRWAAHDTPYNWACTAARHDREQAANLRQVLKLKLPQPPR